METKFTLWHKTGPHQRAAFSDPHTARICEWGLRHTRNADMWYFENAEGEKVTFEENRYGHAFAILAALDRKD